MQWDVFTAIAGGASVAGLVLGVILGGVSWRLSRQTDQLIRDSAAHTQELIAQVHAETLTVLDRIDQRAEERHRFDR
jgi:hypothetical protein